MRDRVTKGQIIMLNGFWKEARLKLDPLAKNWSTAENRQHRLEFASRALGRTIESFNELSKSFDVDALKGALLAVIRPDDLNAQLQQQDMHTTRMRMGLRKVVRELGVSEAYVEGIAKQMNSEGSLGSSRVDSLDADGIHKLIIALHRYKARHGSDSLARNYELRDA
jgi:hypothetical protein